MMNKAITSLTLLLACLAPLSATAASISLE